MTARQEQKLRLDAAREGYLRAMEDVYAAILAGDLTSMLVSFRRKEHMDEVEPLCLSVETRIALERR